MDRLERQVAEERLPARRQLPSEARAFAQVDKTFKDIMRRTHDRPNALQVGF